MSTGTDFSLVLLPLALCGAVLVFGLGSLALPPAGADRSLPPTGSHWHQMP